MYVIVVVVLIVVAVPAWVLKTALTMKMRRFLGGEVRSKKIYDLAKDNVMTVLFTWQIVAHTAQLNEMVRERVTQILTLPLCFDSHPPPTPSPLPSLYWQRGGSHLPEPFETMFRSLEDITSLDFFNAFHVSCRVGHATYAHRIVFASMLPIFGIVLSTCMFARLASKPSIGVKKSGEAFSEERLKRDWLEIGVIKYSNMLNIYLWPVSVKTVSIRDTYSSSKI